MISCVVMLGSMDRSGLVVTCSSKSWVVESVFMLCMFAVVAWVSAFRPILLVMGGSVNGVPSDCEKCCMFLAIRCCIISSLSLTILVLPSWSVMLMDVRPCDLVGWSIALSLWYVLADASACCICLIFPAIFFSLFST